MFIKPLFKYLIQCKCIKILLHMEMYYKSIPVHNIDSVLGHVCWSYISAWFYFFIKIQGLGEDALKRYFFLFQDILATQRQVFKCIDYAIFLFNNLSTQKKTYLRVPGKKWARFINLLLNIINIVKLIVFVFTHYNKYTIILFSYYTNPPLPSRPNVTFPPSQYALPVPNARKYWFLNPSLIWK